MLVPSELAAQWQVTVTMCSFTYSGLWATSQETQIEPRALCFHLFPSPGLADLTSRIFY